MPAHYQEFGPPPTLRPLVDCIWIFRPDGCAPIRQPVFPDAATDLVVSGTDVLVHGPHATARTILLDGPMELAEVIGEGDRVMVRAFMLGRHIGPFQGLPPTGRRIRQAQFHLLALADPPDADRSDAGPKIVAHRAQRDDLGLLLQLGMRLQPGPVAM